jgi:hypothetical protein
MQRFIVALLAAFFVTVPASAFADLDTNTDPPAGVATTTATLADVLAASARARGKALASFATRIEEWSIETNGSGSTERVVWSGDDFKRTENAGPLSTQNGRIGGVSWEHTENGITVIGGGVHHEAEAFDASLRGAAAGKPGDAVKLLGEVTTPVTAYVVEVRPPGDPPTWLFYDKSSGLLVRRESIDEGVRTTATYGDFKTFSAAVVATTVKRTNGDPSYDSLSTLASLRLDVPVPRSELNIPATRQGLVEFPPGVTSVRLPASLPLPGSAPRLLDKDNTISRSALRRSISVRVNINGRGLDFILDSGASGILIDKDVADSLGLKRYGVSGQELQGHADASRVVVPEMRIGDLTMKNIVAYSVGFEDRPADTEKVVGLLGFDFIASVGLKVDWDKGELTAFAPGAMSIPENGIAVPINLDDRVPDISVSVGDAQSDHFILDTGAEDVIIFPGFAAQHRAELADQGLGSTVQHVYGDSYIGVVGGAAKVYPVQVKRFVFGVAFNKFLVDVVDPSSQFQFQDTDGLVGWPFFHYFNLYFDYANSRIVLEPDGDFRKAVKAP